MQVSFIIPLYNCLGHTQECLRTLQASLPVNLSHEIILVDDGSTDGTREWLSTLAPSCRVLLNERNLGYAGANNRGAAIAQGELLCLLNNDLVFAPGWFEPLLNTHRRLSSPGIVGNVQYNAKTGALDHAGIIFTHKGKPAHDTSYPLPAMLFAGYRAVAAVTGACILLTRDLWQTLRGFDENYVNGSEDIDLCFKALAAGRTNAVAVRSNIRHHVSISPGRKLHDERNSHRLTLRWQREIAVLSLPAWCHEKLVADWGQPRASRDLTTALNLLTYSLGLRPTPPPAAHAGVAMAITQELARWEKLFQLRK